MQAETGCQTPQLSELNDHLKEQMCQDHCHQKQIHDADEDVDEENEDELPSDCDQIVSESDPKAGPLTVHQTFKICGFEFQFYSTGLVLPQDFMTEHEIEDDWLVAIQSGKEYKEMISVFQHSFNTGAEVDREAYSAMQKNSDEGIKPVR